MGQRTHTGSANGRWTVPAARLCYTDTTGTAVQGRACRAPSEGCRSTPKGFGKHSEVCVIFGHWKSRQREQTLVPQRYLGGRCVTPWPCRSPGIPRAVSRCPRCPCTAGWRGAAPHPPSVTHWHRHSDTESWVGTTGAVTVPEPARRARERQRGILGSRAPLPPQHGLPPAPTKRLQRPADTG